jgi:hypothetical protein
VSLRLLYLIFVQVCGWLVLDGHVGRGLADGTIVEIGTPAALFGSPATSAPSASCAG